ncbi:hypothetical protein, partial [Bifidobacterium vansinderenii]
MMDAIATAKTLIDRDYARWNMEEEDFTPSDATLEAAFSILAPCAYDREALDRWARDRADTAGCATFFGSAENAIDESNLKTCETIIDELGENCREVRDGLEVEIFYEMPMFHGWEQTPTIAAAIMFGAERYIEDEYAILDEDDYIEREDTWLWETFTWTVGDMIPKDV